MSEEVLVEVQGPLTFRVVHDRALGYLYANIPVGKRLTREAVREIVTATHDPWRYVDGMGLVLDISAWTHEGDVDVQALSKALEAKYKEILDSIAKIVEEAGEAKRKTKKKKKRKAKKKKKKAKKSKRSRKKKRKSKK
ncbi:MAG: hypothetical protein QXP98_08745 [Thermoproteus sp.]